MRFHLLLPVFVGLVVLGLDPPGYAQEPDSQGPEDAVYVYDLFQGADNCLELFGRLRRLPLRATVILSIEQGADFILDQTGGEEKLRCVLRFLNGSERRVKALFLQDHGFLRDGPEAARRAALLGEFVARYPGELSGVQIDVEPYADTKWEASPNDRRRLLEGLHELLRQIRPHLRGLPLSAVVPWWYAEAATELPEAAPAALFQVADELYVMLYGDERERLVWNPARLLRWVGLAPRSPGNARTHLVVATYEFPSQDRLEVELRNVRRLLASRSDFAGTAVFHAQSRFQTRPLP
jgi:hypothetical protein